MDSRRRRRRFPGARCDSLLLLHLLLLCPTCSGYAPATEILLNCGSSDDVRQDGRRFVADQTSSDEYQFLGPTLNLTNPKVKTKAAPSSVYFTARVSSSPYSYELTVGSTGTHFLRLHFSPFSTTSTGKDYDLYNATFGISIRDTFRLLANFSPAGKTTPIVKEYLLWASSDEGVNLTFTPADNSIAFVNAIEIFTAPEGFLPEEVTNFITPQGRRVFPGLRTNNGLEALYRINAGGSSIGRRSDELWRKWSSEKDHLFRKRLTQRGSTSKKIEYMNNSISARVFAPESVYSTARLIKADENGITMFNATWNFSVAADHSYLVRIHLCDLNLTSPDDLYFDVYLNNMMATEGLRPANYTNGTALTAFFLDYIVAVGAESMIGVSLGPPQRRGNVSENSPTAILNGLEILKLNNSMGSFDGLDVFKPSSRGGKRTVSIAAAIVVGVVVLVVAMGGVVFFVWKRNKVRRRTGERSRGRSGRAEWKSVPSSTNGGVVAGSRVHFRLHISLEELKLATKNFDEKLVLGSGGFGDVYYGELRDGNPVAVKRGTSASKQGNPEFQNEINLLSQIRHRHLVSLIGFCEESNQMILVYEYMNKGTLRSHLYDRNDGRTTDESFLSWEQRLNICIGAARGLHYLHTGYSPGIIHRDVKSSNILLTAEEGEGADDYLAKVSDFGLSRVGPDAGKTHVSTAVKGSFGYLDPEYFRTQKLTEKSDVYSFGVVLFEVLCARAAIDPTAPREKVNLAEWAVGKQRAGMLEDIVDRRLNGAVRPESLRKFGETAEKCLVEDGWNRPSMGDVLWNLELALQLQELHGDGGAGAEECGVAVSPPPGSGR